MAFPSATVSANVEDPAILDHWEGDLITGSQNTHISHFGGPSVALHPVRENTGERHYQCGTSIEHADMTIAGGIALATIWDRGMKLAQHKGLTVDTTVRVYSCDPQSRWQRCTDEHTNHLLREYFLKGTNLSRDAQADLNTIA
ncbi:MAG: IS30 family transposase [Nitrospiraceae bacterium]|nr:IS30 family transposase [Nitrospiraceae bacterium]